MKMGQNKEMVTYGRDRARAVGYMLWFLILVFGIGGWIFWKWYAFPLALAAGFIFGSIYSTIQAKKVQRATGLNIHDQERLYEETKRSGNNHS